MCKLIVTFIQLILNNSNMFSGCFIRIVFNKMIFALNYSNRNGEIKYNAVQF